MGSNDGESRAPAERPGGEFHVELKNSGQSMFAEGMYEARLVFPPRRTRFKNVRLRKPHGDTQPVVAREDGQNLRCSAKGSVLLWVAWDQQLPPDQALSLTVTYEGERPMQPEIKPGVPHLRSLGSVAREKALDILHSQLLDDFLKSRMECIEKVRKIDPTRAQRMDFFLEYDVATNPEFVRRANDRLANLIKDSTKALVARVTERLSPGHNLPSLDKRVATRLSGLQLKIFKKHFGTSTGQIKFASFRDAFIAFSRGDLEQGPDCVSKWNGKPDSANFFLFAEFAIQCCDLGVHANVWESILPVFVECQDLYANVFKPFCDDGMPITPVPCHKRGYDTYGDPGAKRAPYDLVTVEQQMRTRYGNAGMQGAPKDVLEILHTENAKRFFPLGKSGSSSPCEALI